jgi:uncharacterized membrane protein
MEQLVNLGASRRILLKDAAIVTKAEDGAVEILDKTSGAKAGSGAMVGALVGVLFPPAILASAAVGGAAGGVLRHVTRALSRSDVKDLGEMLDRGQVCLIAVAEQESAEVVTDAMLGATERVARPMTVDRQGLEDALREVEGA